MHSQLRYLGTFYPYRADGGSTTGLGPAKGLSSL